MTRFSCIILENDEGAKYMTKEEFDEILDEELIRESDIIEKGVLAKENIRIKHMTQEEIDEAYDKFMKRLQEHI